MRRNDASPWLRLADETTSAEEIRVDPRPFCCAVRTPYEANHAAPGGAIGQTAVGNRTSHRPVASEAVPSPRPISR